MFIGRYLQGDWIRLRVLTRNAAGAPAWPTNAGGTVVHPFVSVYDSSDIPVTLEQQLPAMDRANVTGLHEMEMRLGPEFPAGQYTALFEWAIASNSENRGEVQQFEVVAGGDDDGAFVGLHFTRQPFADFLIGETDAGRLVFQRGPKL